MLRELGLPLSQDDRSRLVRSGAKMRQALERRRDQLSELNPSECERQVRAVVIDIDGIDPVALVAEEVKMIDGLIEDLLLVFAGHSLALEYLSSD